MKFEEWSKPIGKISLEDDIDHLENTFNALVLINKKDVLTVYSYFNLACPYKLKYYKLYEVKEDTDRVALTILDKYRLIPDTEIDDIKKILSVNNDNLNTIIDKACYNIDGEFEETKKYYTQIIINPVITNTDILIEINNLFSCLNGYFIIDELYEVVESLDEYSKDVFLTLTFTDDLRIVLSENKDIADDINNTMILRCYDDDELEKHSDSFINERKNYC